MHFDRTYHPQPGRFLGVRDNDNDAALEVRTHIDAREGVVFEQEAGKNLYTLLDGEQIRNLRDLLSEWLKAFPQPAPSAPKWRDV